MVPAFIPNEASYIVITCTVAMVWTFLTYIIRIFLRTKVNGPFGWDDVCALLATLFGLGDTTVTLVAVRFGLAYHERSVSPANLQMVSLLIWIFNQLYVCATGFAILSVSFLICRIASKPKDISLGYTFAGLTALWTFTSICFLAFQCDLPRPWDFTPPSRCFHRWHFWLGSMISNAVLEICNVALALYIVWDLQMPSRPKTCVKLAFLSRLLVLPPLFVRMKYVHATLYGSDTTYDRIGAIVLSQITMHLSIALATLPCAKPFFVVFEGGVFRSPHDAPFHSDSTESLQRGGGNQARDLPSWDRRQSFAKGSAVRVQGTALRPKAISFKLNRLSWTRRRHASDGDGPVTPPSIYRPRAPSHTKPEHWSNSSSGSSIRGTTRHGSGVGRRLADRTPSYRLRAMRRARLGSRSREADEVTWFEGLRGDSSRTITVIQHDPEEAGKARGKTSLHSSLESEGRDGIIHTREVRVSYEAVRSGPDVAGRNSCEGEFGENL